MEMEIEEIHDYWVIKIYAFSEIIYDHLGKAGQLKEKALEMFGRTFSDINKNRDLQNYYNAYDAYQKYKGMIHRNLHWKIMYYECIKYLLVAYCYHNKLPLIPWNKAQRLFSDEKYRNRYHLKDIPDAIFCNLFMYCLTDNEESAMHKHLEQLYNYCVSESEFNPSECIIIK